MKKFEWRNPIVEAEQWFPGKDVEGVKHSSYDHLWNYVDLGPNRVQGLEAGDWIIKDPTESGYFSVLKPDEFEELYKPKEAHIDTA